MDFAEELLRLTGGVGTVLPAPPGFTGPFSDAYLAEIPKGLPQVSFVTLEEAAAAALGAAARG